MLDVTGLSAPLVHKVMHDSVDKSRVAKSSEQRVTIRAERACRKGTLAIGQSRSTRALICSLPKPAFMRETRGRSVYALRLRFPPSASARRQARTSELLWLALVRHRHVWRVDCHIEQPVRLPLDHAMASARRRPKRRPVGDLDLAVAVMKQT